MNGKNTAFAVNPKTFLESNLVNVSAMMGADHVELARNTALMNTSKAGSFDLRPWKSNNLLRWQEASVVTADIPLLAYFCPFVGGGAAPGWVDVPRAVPLHRFVFTPAMNGCAFIITASPTGGHFRVHHHQHPLAPGDRSRDEPPLTLAEYDRFTEAEYDKGSSVARLAAGTMFATFVALFRDQQGAWNFISQAMEFSAATANAEWKRAAGVSVVTRAAKTS